MHSHLTLASWQVDLSKPQMRTLAVATNDHRTVWQPVPRCLSKDQNKQIKKTRSQHVFTLQLHLSLFVDVCEKYAETGIALDKMRRGQCTRISGSVIRPPLEIYCFLIFSWICQPQKKTLLVFYSLSKVAEKKCVKNVPTCPWFCLARPFSPPLRLATRLRPLRLPLLSRVSPPPPFTPTCCWSLSDKAKSLFCSGRESPVGRGLRGVVLILDPVVQPAHLPPSVSSSTPRSPASQWRPCSSKSRFASSSSSGWAGSARTACQGCRSGLGCQSESEQCSAAEAKRPLLRGCNSQTSGI